MEFIIREAPSLPDFSCWWMFTDPLHKLRRLHERAQHFAWPDQTLSFPLTTTPREPVGGSVQVLLGM